VSASGARVVAANPDPITIATPDFAAGVVKVLHRGTRRSPQSSMTKQSVWNRSELSPEPGIGRVYRSTLKIRLSDAAQDGRLRLDAMARYMQDVASDDVADADADDDAYTWVVRRTVIDVVSPFGADSAVALSTWASATGPRWAGLVGSAAATWRPRQAACASRGFRMEPRRPRRGR